jgi:hypothetical protein
MTWQYKFELNLEEHELNDLGGQGWELVAATPCGKENSYSGFYFKRMREAVADSDVA